MHVLYEEEGELKVGSVLAQAPASLQVESPHGRRSKVKTANVLLRFEQPTASELLAQAQRFAEGLEVDFVWQCSGAAEFDFQRRAREYVGREPSVVEAAGVLLKLHGAPMYFYRRGKGRFQPAPEATLKLALAGLEKKKRVLAQQEAWAQSLARFDCPAEIAALQDELLYAPERNRPRRAPSSRLAATPASARQGFSSVAACSTTHTSTTSSAFCMSSFRAGRALPRIRYPRRKRICRSHRPLPSALMSSAPLRSTTRSR